MFKWFASRWINIDKEKLYGFAFRILKLDVAFMVTMLPEDWYGLKIDILGPGMPGAFFQLWFVTLHVGFGKGFLFEDPSAIIIEE